MTKVTTLANMPSSGEDVSVIRLDQSILGWAGTEKDAKTGTIISTYVVKNGDPSVDTTVVVTTGTSSKDGVTRNSIRLTTNEKVYDDVALLYLVDAPIEVVIAWNHSGPLYDTAKVRDMISSAFSLAFTTLTAKVPDTGIIDAVNHGLLTELYS